ncbi:MAG: hypothetical protein ACON49_07515 [Candidatus Puniceispirillaceae bacterium]
MSKIDQLSERLAALHVEMERRFGQMTTALFLIGAAVIVAIGPQSLVAQILLGIIK